MRRSMVCVLLACLAACSSDDVTAPSAAGTSPAAATATSAPTTIGTAADEDIVVTPVGFDRVQAFVTEPDGTICELCLWLADTPDRRSRGLMFVTDLGDGDGMAFVYRGPHTGNFWMKNTVLPLSIAFFDADGGFRDAFDMEPCTADPCDLHPTPDDFLIAVETTRGGLAHLGIGPGSVLELTELPCS